MVSLDSNRLEALRLLATLLSLPLFLDTPRTVSLACYRHVRTYVRRTYQPQRGHPTSQPNPCVPALLPAPHSRHTDSLRPRSETSLEVIQFPLVHY